jgi:hypothetical protein
MLNQIGRYLFTIRGSEPTSFSRRLQSPPVAFGFLLLTRLFVFYQFIDLIG